MLIALVATPGPVAISCLALPFLVDLNSIPIPLETLQISAAIQSIVLVVLASVIGARLRRIKGSGSLILNKINS